ncbi:MAG TPA: HlyD family efflux transporter periplasmic adaptor subunit [Thermoanaerobaculia bacterium]|nr:HlyD family efflux transporter periplasmic adaptor subunit [Thermoanaerobaculia bacterium]
MDILREDIGRRKRRRRFVFGGAGVGAILLITLGLSRLKPAAPTVDRSTVLIDVVKRGALERQVRGPGSLVPETEGIRQISASTDARVERLLAQPGAPVLPDTVLLEMSNSELERDALDADWQLKAGQADLANTRVKLQKELLDQQAAAATVESDYHQAQLQAETNEGLFKEGLVAAITLKLSQTRARELATRNEIEKKRLAVSSEAERAQLAAQEARVEQLRALARLKRSQMDALRVRAGIRGVLQEVPVQPGQRVTPGMTLAKVVQPEKLKAQLKIAETQARDVQNGERASIDTRNGVVEGHVSRIDPSVQGGTVTVDVALDGPLPKGARPDLSVDGTIELERLADVVFVGRPAFGSEQSNVTLFRLRPDSDEAVRVRVRFGKSSVNAVEVLEGLKPGDKVVLSDMSAWDAFDRVRLK